LAGEYCRHRLQYLLEFLDLKDEYSESELEGALVRHLVGALRELFSLFTTSASEAGSFFNHPPKHQIGGQ
jgi:hypothetical protein